MATRGTTHYCAASWPTTVAATHDRAMCLGAAHAAVRLAHSAAAFTLSGVVTSLTREVAGYTLGVAALDSDGEAVAVAVLIGTASDGRKERQQCGARIVRRWGPMGDGEG
jgi:hypothetical protein